MLSPWRSHSTLHHSHKRCHERNLKIFIELMALLPIWLMENTPQLATTATEFCRTQRFRAYLYIGNITYLKSWFTYVMYNQNYFRQTCDQRRGRYTEPIQNKSDEADSYDEPLIKVYLLSKHGLKLITQVTTFSYLFHRFKKFRAPKMSISTMPLRERRSLLRYYILYNVKYT